MCLRVFAEPVPFDLRHSTLNFSKDDAGSILQEKEISNKRMGSVAIQHNKVSR